MSSMWLQFVGKSVRSCVAFQTGTEQRVEGLVQRLLLFFRHEPTGVHLTHTALHSPQGVLEIAAPPAAAAAGISVCRQPAAADLNPLQATPNLVG